jgi:S-adenosylmethionine:tRNA ribosyltransferase-isomerase
VRTVDFDYPLPPELIAQQPAPARDQSRLLVLHHASGAVEHRLFRDLPALLRAGDVLVFNDSKVVPARLRGVKAGGGGEIEILLLEENSPNDWWVMLRPGKRVRAGTEIHFPAARAGLDSVSAVVREKNPEGHCRLEFRGVTDLPALLEERGEVPLPPYIERNPGASSVADRERYQTVFARQAGSVAAPTAGLHFTEALLAGLRGRGVETHFVTLHVGLGTFAPVKAETVEEHVMHEERFTLPAATATALNRAREEGRRIIAVGTTSVRVLESVAAQHEGRLVATQGRTRIFIHPPFRFRVVDALLTNFHLPQSTLLMLVSAFASPGETRGRELVLRAYAEAVRERYRFFSYGDAMFMA